jgi:ATP-binding cassette subfamily B protein
VDIRTEAVILEALERLMRNRTVFIIAHRPSTLAGCEKVLLIEDGRVARIGSPNSASFIESFMLGDKETGDG